MSNPEPSIPRAAVFGCSGSVVTAEERRFFRDADPLGFILFRRNCEAPGQVRALVASLRDCVGRGDAPVLIDQEGGRVARLGPPHWRAPPPAGVFGGLARRDAAAAGEAVRLNARLMAAELADLGVTVDCAPVLDLRHAGAHEIVGDRAFGAVPESVAALATAFCEGLCAGGVLPVIKHIPGHGRGRVDSHAALPEVDTPRATLAATDFRPFAMLADRPWAMTAHVVYTAIDAARPATLSAAVIDKVVRREIGFDGVLISDDLSMGALGGGLGARTAAALGAGCDLALHCNARMDEMTAVAEAASPLTAKAAARLARGEAMRGRADAFDRGEALARLLRLLGAAADGGR